MYDLFMFVFMCIPYTYAQYSQYFKPLEICFKHTYFQNDSFSYQPQ